MTDSWDRRLRGLEAEYERLLRDALEKCAAGRWGLFGRNAKLMRREPEYVLELLALGEEIEQMRRKLGNPNPFEAHAHLLLLRANGSANAPGEPRLAKQWLSDWSQGER